jgi:hypothetical protein
MKNLALVRSGGRVGMGDFVPGGFPEPHNPIGVRARANWDPSPRNGMGDFVLANFPEPHNPIAGNLSGCGCGSGCGCDDCASGMGAIAEPSWTTNLPTFLQGSYDIAGGIPKVYALGGGLLAGFIVLPMFFGKKKGRR